MGCRPGSLLQGDLLPASDPGRHLIPDLRARGKTILIISHDDHYYHTADRILKLLDGRIEFDGEAESYLEFMARTDAVQRDVQ